MKIANYIQTLFKDCVFILCLLVSSSGLFASEKEIFSKKEAFAHLSSFTSQVATPDNNKIVTMESIDELSGLKVEENKKVIVKESGLYFVIVSGRVGTEGISLVGNIDLFLMKNGQPIPHSYTNYQSLSRITTSNLVSHVVLPLKKGDYISVGISSDSTNLGLIAFSTPHKKIPSLIFSMYQIQN